MVVRAVRFAVLCLLATALSFGQGMGSRGIEPLARGRFSGRPFPVKFVDVGREAGLTATSIYGGLEKTRYLFETSSGGAAFIDYDRDGWVDIFIVNGTRLEDPPPKDATNRLYRNNHDGTFTDVTERAGLRHTGWGNSVAIGDYDNDGWDDLFVTYYGQNVLYRNNGNGTFSDVTAAANLLESPAPPHPRWGAGATFVDYDLDGKLDLFVSNYVDFDESKVPGPGANGFCNWKGIPVACGPRGLPPPTNLLFHNEGNGKFKDVSDGSGISKAKGSYGMTSVGADLDGDGWPDILVACDSTPSFMFHNNKNGTFSEEGIQRGLALSDDGREQAGMGLALADFNLDGRIDIFKTHFADDTQGLYENLGKGSFQDVTIPAGLGVETRVVAWGVGMPDLDNDGLPDLFMTPGGVYPETNDVLTTYPYKLPRLVFRNLGDGKFEQILGMAGPGVEAPHSSRGCAFGDYDNDGDIDVVIFNRNEPPSLLRNDCTGKNHWITVKLIGSEANRSAIGAEVTAFYGGKRQVGVVLSQSSFYSANDLRLHFGLGAAEKVDLEVRWPSGQPEKIESVPADRIVTIRQGAGIQK